MADEIEPKQLVQGIQHIGLGDPGGCGSELGIERIARDRRTFQDEPRPFRQQRELLPERRGHACHGLRLAASLAETQPGRNAG